MAPAFSQAGMSVQADPAGRDELQVGEWAAQVRSVLRPDGLGGEDFHCGGAGLPGGVEFGRSEPAGEDGKPMLQRESDDLQVDDGGDQIPGTRVDRALGIRHGGDRADADLQLAPGVLDERRKMVDRTGGAQREFHAAHPISSEHLDHRVIVGGLFGAEHRDQRCFQQYWRWFDSGGVGHGVVSLGDGCRATEVE